MHAWTTKKKYELDHFPLFSRWVIKAIVWKNNNNCRSRGLHFILFSHTSVTQFSRYVFKFAQNTQKDTKKIPYLHSIETQR